MGHFVETQSGKTFSAPSKLVHPSNLAAASSPLAWKILQELAKRPQYPKEVARILKVNEQKVYYHIRNLEAAGLIKLIHSETKQGALAKIYAVDEHAFTVLVKPMEHAPKLQSSETQQKKFLEPFISEGRLNATIVMGSPEPHGPNKARAKDGAEVAQLGLFLGSFLQYIPKANVKLDTEIRESDLRKNLIVVGGPAVNTVMARLNEKLPIGMSQKQHGAFKFSSIYSALSKKTYAEENHGIIVKCKNPFDKTKDILILAGRRSAGTKAAILACLTNLDAVCKSNEHDKKTLAHVVEGIDANSDGVLDAVDVLE